MLLAIDARNRGIAVGFRAVDRGPCAIPQGGASASPWFAIRRIGASPERSADEYALLFEAFSSRAVEEAARRGLISERVDEAIISSVSPALVPRLAEALRRAFGVEVTVLGPGARTGLKIRTDNPAEVGSDLVAEAVAARELVGAPAIVVDFGEALAISALSAAGEFVGAAIAPGLDAAAASLHRQAALIPEVRLDRPSRAIGRSTAEAIRAGLVLGYAGLVGRLVALMRDELAADSPLAPRAAVVGTGDSACRPLLESALGGESCRFEAELALEGLAIVAARGRR